MEGEITTEAHTDGRRITLDPIMPRYPLGLPVRRVESTLPCGFRVGWLAGESTDPDSELDSFDLTCGAGVGNGWLALTVQLTDGSTRYEVVDMREVAQAWIDAVLAAGPSPKVGES
jgi:hypothetical protein